MKILPKEFYKYFWDTKPEGIDVENKSRYVIARLMDYGHTSAIMWMRKAYSEKDMREVLTQTKGLDRKSAQFWLKMLKVDAQEVKCLQKPYRRIPYGV